MQPGATKGTDNATLTAADFILGRAYSQSSPTSIPLARSWFPKADARNGSEFNASTLLSPPIFYILQGKAQATPDACWSAQWHAAILQAILFLENGAVQSESSRMMPA